MNCIKLEFYVPESHATEVKNAVFTAGAGKIGNYDCCCWETLGNGQFRPSEGSQPFIGQLGKIEQTPEIKVEIICEKQFIQQVIEALKSAHPYETPAYQYWEIHF